VAFDLLLAICSPTAFGLMIVMVLQLPENAWPQSCFEDCGDRMLTVVAGLFADLTISATADFTLSFLNVFRRRSQCRGDQQDEREFCPP
jgi:hypothetical protein